MNKKELVRKVRETVKAQLPKPEWAKAEVIEKTVDALLETIKKEVLAGGEVSIREFGRFYLKETSPRTARNPKTGEKVKIKARKRFTFKPSSKIKFVDLSKPRLGR